MSDTTQVEDVESFRQRARDWISGNLKRVEDSPMMRSHGSMTDDEELAHVEWTRELQRKFFDGGFAGITVPTEYGGQGLTIDHARAFNQEIHGYEYPARIQVPTFTPCMAVLLEFGNEEMKKKHIPAILKGEEIWMQFLSEPSGGSDVAGAQTTAVRDGDEWVLNGSKIWTTGAWWSDWGLCLARTNWDVPKHRGLTVFILPIHQDGIEIQRIEMLNGNKEFCQEFITDVRIPDGDRVSEVDDGWTVGIRWMFHERSFGSSPYIIRPGDGGHMAGMRQQSMLSLARQSGRDKDLRSRELIGEAHANSVASGALLKRIPEAMATGYMTDQAAALGRLMGGVTGVRSSSISLELSGTGAIAWTEDDEELGERGIGYLTRQSSCIAGGTTEMARNVISERVLGMPRERTLDKDVAFREVPKGPPAT